MSNFDPEKFIDSTITEPSTRRPPLPIGDYVGVVGKPEVREQPGKQDPTKVYIIADVPVMIDASAYPNLGPAFEGAKIQLSDSLFLDLNEGGQIDTTPGKNSKLRRYRDALDMNKPGVPFSFRAMEGKMIKVKVSHREYEGERYDQIEAVAKA